MNEFGLHQPVMACRYGACKSGDRQDLRTCARESSFSRSVLRSYHNWAKTGLFILYRSLWPNRVARNTGPVPGSSLNSFGCALEDVGSPSITSNCSEVDQFLRTEGCTASGKHNTLQRSGAVPAYWQKYNIVQLWTRCCYRVSLASSLWPISSLSSGTMNSAKVSFSQLFSRKKRLDQRAVDPDPILPLTTLAIIRKTAILAPTEDKSFAINGVKILSCGAS